MEAKRENTNTSRFSKRNGTILNLCSEIAQQGKLTNKKKIKNYGYNTK